MEKNSIYSFVIVHSRKLLEIRKKIYEEFLGEGGKKEAFDPSFFFPHITIGYAGKRDLWESDGVLKSIENTLDPRFNQSDHLLNLIKQSK